MADAITGALSGGGLGDLGNLGSLLSGGLGGLLGGGGPNILAFLGGLVQVVLLVVKFLLDFLTGKPIPALLDLVQILIVLSTTFGYLFGGGLLGNLGSITSVLSGLGLGDIASQLGSLGGLAGGSSPLGAVTGALGGGSSGDSNPLGAVTGALGGGSR